MRASLSAAVRMRNTLSDARSLCLSLRNTSVSFVAASRRRLCLVEKCSNTTDDNLFDIEDNVYILHWM